MDDRRLRVAGNISCISAVNAATVHSWRGAPVVDPRSEAVGNATSAESDAVVRGALGVHVAVRVVAEQFGTPPADLVDGLLGSGSVTTIEEFIGSQLRRWPWILRGESLEATQDDRCAHRAAVASPPALLDPADRRLLEDRHADGLDDARQAQHQLGGLDAGAVRG